MANILDIRRRIRSVINTRQITKAMKMVSAAKLRRAQERALAARPYAQMLTNVLRSLVQRAEIYDPQSGEPRHPLLAERPENRILLLVVSGDKGLAGAFNASILKAALRFIETKAGKRVELFAVGRKGRDFLRRRYSAGEAGGGTDSPNEPKSGSLGTPDDPNQLKSGSLGAPEAGVTLIGEQVNILNRLQFAHAAALSEQAIERYTRGEIDALYVIYNEFKSVIAQRLVVERVLPIHEIGASHIALAEEATPEEAERRSQAALSAGVEPHAVSTHEIDAKAAAFATAQVDYIYEQPEKELFQALLPKYVGVQIYRAMLESVAAEHAARMTAMDSATNNATDMIDSLTLAMNRARQAKITKEIIEIVSGAAVQ